MGGTNPNISECLFLLRSSIFRNTVWQLSIPYGLLATLLKTWSFGPLMNEAQPRRLSIVLKNQMRSFSCSLIATVT